MKKRRFEFEMECAGSFVGTVEAESQEEATALIWEAFKEALPDAEWDIVFLEEEDLTDEEEDLTDEEEDLTDEEEDLTDEEEPPDRHGL